MLLQQQSAGFERLELALEFGDADDPRNEFYALVLQKILVVALRVLCDQTDAGCPWVDERMYDGSNITVSGD